MNWWRRVKEQLLLAAVALTVSVIALGWSIVHLVWLVQGSEARTPGNVLEAVAPGVVALLVLWRWRRWLRWLYRSWRLGSAR